MIIHDVPLFTADFEEIASGRRTYYVQFNDEGFAVGDQIIFREFVPDVGRGANIHTGRELIRCIASLQEAEEDCTYGLAPGWCIMSIVPIPVKVEEVTTSLKFAVRRDGDGAWLRGVQRSSGEYIWAFKAQQAFMFSSKEEIKSKVRRMSDTSIWKVETKDRMVKEEDYVIK